MSFLGGSSPILCSKRLLAVCVIVVQLGILRLRFKYSLELFNFSTIILNHENSEKKWEKYLYLPGMRSNSIGKEKSRLKPTVKRVQILSELTTYSQLPLSIELGYNEIPTYIEVDIFP